MSVLVPIQPWDDTLREKICEAIRKPFEEDFKAHGYDYDPDIMGRAADNVIALFVAQLLGIKVTLLPQAIIGNGTLSLDRNSAP